MRLEEYMENLNEITNEIEEEGVQRRVRLYLFWLCGGIIFFDKSGNKFSTDFLIDMRDLPAMSTQAWGAIALSYFYFCLYRESMEKSHCISGFVSLLQVWAWERIVPLQSLPLLSSEENSEVPTAHARKWFRGRTHQNEARSVLFIIRDVLANLTEKQIYLAVIF
ncbi:protein MAIN-LIKE 2-like [Capsicum annuum]